MTTHRWRTTLTVQARDLEQDETIPMVTGLVETTAGGGPDSAPSRREQPVILTVQDARQLAGNLDDTITQRLRVTAEHLGEHEQERGDSQP